MDYQHYRDFIDPMYYEALQMTHRGKDIDQAIKESYLHLLATPERMAVTDQGDFKRLVNGWLTNKRFPSKPTQTKKLVNMKNI